MIIQLYISYARIFSLQKGISKVSFRQPLPNNVVVLFKLPVKKTSKKLTWNEEVGTVLFSDRCLGHLTRFLKNFVANLSYQITDKI